MLNYMKLELATQPKIGSRFGLDSVPNRDVAKSSFGPEEYGLFQAGRKARFVMRSAAIRALIEAVSRANGPRCRVVPEVRR